MAHILLIRDAEPLPLAKQEKMMRMGMLAEALLKNGHQVTWLASTFNHHKKEFYYTKDTQVAVSEDLRCILMHVGGYASNISMARIRHHRLLAKKVKQHLLEHGDQYDIAVVSLPTVNTAYEVVKFGKENNMPIIVDVRDMWPDVFKDYLPNILKPLVSIMTTSMRNKAKYSLKNATLLTSMSQFVCDWAVDMSGRTKPKAIYHLGSSLDNLKPKKINKLDHNDENLPLTCVYVGGLVRAYDLSVVLQASVLTQKDVRYIIVGDGPLRQSYESIETGNNVFFKGWQDKNNVAKYLLQADILLLPVQEAIKPNMPNKLFDYLWAAKPILACIHGEAADIITHHNLGYVFKHDDVDDFIVGLKQLKSKLVRDEIQQNSQSLYNECYSAKKIYQQFSEKIEGIIQNNSQALMRAKH